MAGSVYPIEDGKRFRGILYLKDEFGISFRKTFTGKDRKKLQKKVDRYEQDYKAGRPSDGMKVEAMCLKAIQVCEERECAAKTLKGYRDFLRVHIGPAIGAVKIRELTPAHVERMLSLMAGKGAGSQTQMLCRNFLRMAINRVAMKGGFVATNAAALADPPRVKHIARKQLTPEHLERILAAEKRPVLRALWLFLASTGLRPGEARTLMRSDFYEQADGTWMKLRASKTEEGKQPLPMSAVLMDELNALPKTSLYMFPTSSGEPFNESNLRREWVRALDQAGVPFTNLYQLRKLFGTLKARKVPDTVLKRLMRHKDARTTKQFYVSALEQDLREAVEN